MNDEPEMYRVTTRVEIQRVDRDGRWMGNNSLTFDERVEIGPVGLPQVAELLVKCHGLTSDLAATMKSTAPAA